MISKNTPMILRLLSPLLLLCLQQADITKASGHGYNIPAVPPIPAPLGCKSTSAFDQCVAPAASALLCDSTDQECICSGYRINRGCYTLYCPSQTWKFEDRGTQCGSIPTLSAQLLTASPPTHPTPIASDGSQPVAAAAASAGAGAAATATASAAKSSGSHPSSSDSGGATLGMGASSAGGVAKHGGVICWVVVVGLWFWLWSRVLM